MSDLVLNSDIINSLDIEDEIEELQDMLGEDEASPEDQILLKELLTARDEIEGYNSDWKYGIPLINERYFRDYARELAEESIDQDRIRDWPYRCIDWDQAADELRADYSTVEIDGVTYYFFSA